MTDSELPPPNPGDTVVLTDGRVGVVRSMRRTDGGDTVIRLLMADAGTTVDVAIGDVTEVHRSG